MGQPIKTSDYERGTDCPTCTTPFGATWNPGDTPKFIYCTFWSIVNCGLSHHAAPNGEIFRMEQHAVNPCHWQLNGSVWHINYFATIIAPPRSQLRLADHDGWSFFTSTHRVCSPEYLAYNNLQLTCILLYAGSGGRGMIWWNDLIEDQVVDFGLRPGADLMYEAFYVSRLPRVHKYCDRHQRTNIRFLK